MTYSNFASQMLIALYQETASGDRPFISYAALMSRYGLTANEAWLVRLSEDWERDGLAKIARDGAASSWRVEITGRGMREIERSHGPDIADRNILEPVVPKNVLTTENGEPLTTEDGEYLTVEETEDMSTDGASIHAQSEAWTGIAAKIITARNSEQIRVAILKAKEAVRDLGSNEKTAQAIAYLNAAEALTDAPDPPSEIIWHLINRAGAICGVLGLFITLFAVL